MTEQEIAELVKRLREGRTPGTDLRWAVTEIHREAADALEAQWASYESACARAEEAEARNVFLLTELERILKEAK